MQKRTNRLILGCFFLLMAASCDLMEAIQTTPSYFSVSPSRDVVQDAPGEKVLEFQVLCDLPWTAELTDPSWGKIEGVQEKEHHNGVFRLTSGSNPGFSARSNTIKVKAGDKELNIPVSQQGSSSIVPVQQIGFAQHAVQSKLAVNAPSDWTASVEAPGGWFSVEPLSGKAGNVQLILTACDANQDKGERSGRIRFSFRNYTVDLDVLQNQTNVILLAASSVPVSFLAQELTVDTQTNVAYRIEVIGNWVKHLETKALDQAHERFAVEENLSDESRTAIIRFFSEGDNAVDVRMELVQMGQDPILKVHNYGVYGLDGQDFCMGDTFTQLSRLYTSEGKFSMRLLDPTGVQTVSVEGIGPDSVSGSEIPLKVVASAKGYPWLIRTIPCILVLADEKTVWAKATDGSDTYFVLKR